MGKTDFDLTPLHDRVIVLPDTPLEISEGGIIIPDSAKEKPIQGTAVGVGNGVGGESLEVKKGDRVIYNKNAGTVIEIDEKEYVIMRESDILAVL